MSDHRQAKLDIQNLLLKADFDVALCEYHGCDVVGIRRAGHRQCVLAVEVERSVRNVIRNIRRNLARKCDAVVVVGMSHGATVATERLCGRSLTKSETKRVRVVSRQDLTAEFLRQLATEIGVDSGLIQVSSGCFGGLIPRDSNDGLVNSRGGQKGCDGGEQDKQSREGGEIES